MHQNLCPRFKLSIAISLLIIFSACNSSSSKTQGTEVLKQNSDTVKEDLLVNNSIKSIVLLNHNHLIGVKGDLKSFGIYIDKLDSKKLSAIPLMLDYINTCIPPGDSLMQDSIFLLFNMKFYAVANALTISLDSQYRMVLAAFEKDSSTTATRSFTNNLAFCGLGLFLDEGNYYADVQPDYFYDNFKDRVSPATKEFLWIRKKELKEGFSEDAGMLISFDSLYSRVKTWDKFITTYPGCLYYDEANNFYTTYLETLMTGMDNSRVFGGDNNTLSPEIKSLYQKIIAEKPDNRTSRLIASYYDLLAKENFIESDKTDSFLNQNNLSSMLGVEPHLR